VKLKQLDGSLFPPLEATEAAEAAEAAATEAEELQTCGRRRRCRGVRKMAFNESMV
jgi:hypothetical protein